MSKETIAQVKVNRVLIKDINKVLGELHESNEYVIEVLIKERYRLAQQILSIEAEGK